MKITNEEINNIPGEMVFHKFVPSENGTTVISTNNNELVVITHLTESVDKEVVVDKATIKALKKLGASEITINTTFNIKSSNSSYKGKLIDKNIVIPQVNERTDVPVSIEDLIKASKFTSKNGKPIFSGVNISNIGITATDSFKLYNKPFESEINVSATLTTDFINALSKYKIDKIAINERMSIATGSSVVIISNNVIGEYPNVSRLLDTSAYTDLEFNIQDFREEALLGIDLTSVESGYAAISLVQNEEGHLMVKTDEYEGLSEARVGIEGFKITLESNSLKLLLQFDSNQLFYSGEKKPIIAITEVRETVLVLPIVKGGN